MNIKQLAIEIEKYDIIFVGNIIDIVRNNNLNKNQIKELFKELKQLGINICNRDKSFIYSTLEA